MSEQEIYKRYMIFAWDEYDNSSPFGCLKESTDNKEEAIETFNKIYQYDYKCVFDRTEGRIIAGEA